MPKKNYIEIALAGFITIAELAAVIQSLHERPTKEEIQEMVHEVDADGNGSIDFEDFLSIMARKTKVAVNLSTNVKSLIFVDFNEVRIF